MSRVGPKGEALIKEFEGCRLTAYQDPRGIWTIGWGHTGPAVVAGLVIDQAQADAWFQGDLSGTADAVQNMLVRSATQDEFDALVSLAFNVGVSALHASTLLRRFNTGDVAGAARAFGEWIHDPPPHIEPGLVRRRVAEIVLFLGAG